MSAVEAALDGRSQASRTGLDPLRSEAREVSGPIVLLLAGLAAIGTLATNIILPAFPRMAAELGLTGAQLGILLSSFFFTFAPGATDRRPALGSFRKKGAGSRRPRHLPGGKHDRRTS